MLTECANYLPKTDRHGIDPARTQIVLDVFHVAALEDVAKTQKPRSARRRQQSWSKPPIDEIGVHTSTGGADWGGVGGGVGV